jgi:hypothetical protein
MLSHIRNVGDTPVYFEMQSNITVMEKCFN